MAQCGQIRFDIAAAPPAGLMPPPRNLGPVHLRESFLVLAGLACMLNREVQVGELMGEIGLLGPPLNLVQGNSKGFRNITHQGTPPAVVVVAQVDVFGEIRPPDAELCG
jgi:hypothetical protein